MLDESKTIYILQAARALAAIFVVFHHAAIAAHDFGGPFVGSQIFDIGYLGVDFFFLLSGFIIYHSTVDRRKNLFAYGEARASRIYAPYLPIGAGVAILYSFLPKLSLGNRGWDWIATLTLFPFGATALSQAWTLQHEVVFYILFGLFYYTHHLRFGLGLWAVAIVIAFFLGHPNDTILGLISLEFFIGIYAAILTRKGQWHWSMLPAAIGFFVLWWAAGANRDLSVIVGLGFGLFIPPLVAAERCGRLVVLRTLVFLGAASYSVYLVHGLAVSFVGRAIHNPWLILFAASLSGVIAGIGYYLLVERPLLSFVRAWAKTT